MEQRELRELREAAAELSRAARVLGAVSEGNLALLRALMELLDPEDPRRFQRRYPDAPREEDTGSIGRPIREGYAPAPDFAGLPEDQALALAVAAVREVRNRDPHASSEGLERAPAPSPGEVRRRVKERLVREGG